LGAAFVPLLDEYRHYAVYGGRGTAKSNSIAEAIIIRMCIKKELVVCARQFQTSIRDSAKALLEVKISSLGLDGAFKITDNEIINVHNGSRAIFIGMQTNPASMQSIEGVTIAWLEEAQSVSQRAMEIAIPTFMRQSGAKMFWSWNPTDPKDPVDVYFRGGNIPERSYIKEVTQEDNPFFLQSELPIEMEYCRVNNPGRFTHIWLGGYDVISQARIFTNVRQGRVEVPRKAVPLLGMDFGFSQDPNAIVVVYHLPETRQLYISEEATGQVSLDDLEDLLDTVTIAREYVIVADSSRPETIDFLNQRGFTVMGSRKGAGSIKAGINFMQGFEIVVSPECLGVWGEMRSYSWKQDKHGVILKVPEDKNNHFIDAIRYALEAVVDAGGGRDKNDVDMDFIRVRF
jgi:phage terminase large subunit